MLDVTPSQLLVASNLAHGYTAALRTWESAHPGATYDPELFRREILPRLGTVKLSAIMEAAGCSKTFASRVRRGYYTPHVSTWAALAELVGVRLPRNCRVNAE